MKTPASGVGLATCERLDELEAHVQCRVGGIVRDLHLVLYGNGIALQGTCHSYYAKQLAQHAVMAATDLPVVANDIEVL